MTHPDRLLDRRWFLLSTAAAAGAIAAGAGLGPAQASTATGGVPATAGTPATGAVGARVTAMDTRSVGRFDIIALRDAAGPFFLTAEEAFHGATAGDWARARRIDPGAFGLNGTWNLDFRCYAIRRPDGRYSLVDTGVGPEGSPAAAWAPVPGALPQILVRAGIDVQDVDTVVLTHLHEDHAGWSVTPDGVPMFPNARYVVQQTELAALDASGDEAMLGYVVTPLRSSGQLHPVDGAVVLTGDGNTAAALRSPASRSGDRIRVVPTPGHTPGHQSILVEGGRDEQVIITGDVLVHAVQLADPDVEYRFESDQDLARQSRHALLAAARRDRAVLATAHLKRPFIRPN